MKSNATLLLIILLLTFSYGKNSLEDLNIDTTITGFHFAINIQGTNIYTPNGKSDLERINPTAFSFTLLQNATMKTVIDVIENLYTMSEKHGYNFSDIIRQDTTFQGYPAHLISYTETKKGTDYQNYVFNAVVMKDNTAIIFTSGDLSQGIYAEKIKQTFYKIKL